MNLKMTIYLLQGCFLKFTLPVSWDLFKKDSLYNSEATVQRSMTSWGIGVEHKCKVCFKNKKYQHLVSAEFSCVYITS